MWLQGACVVLKGYSAVYNSCLGVETKHSLFNMVVLVYMHRKNAKKAPKKSTHKCVFSVFKRIKKRVEVFQGSRNA